MEASLSFAGLLTVLSDAECRVLDSLQKGSFPFVRFFWGAVFLVLHEPKKAPHFVLRPFRCYDQRPNHSQR